MSQRKKVAVVILGWNGKQYLQQFLPSVIQHTSVELCDLIVADNCSTDGSVEFVKEHYPQIRIVQNSRNGGYAGGYNHALKLVDAEYYVLLNQDVEVTQGWVEKVIEVMETDKTIAAAQPKLLDYNKRNCFEYAGACGGYLDKFGYAFCRGRIFDTIEKDEGRYNDIVDIFWATGACLFIRSEAYRNAGGLDEDFFAHQEEIDLCWRLKSMGMRVVCVPQSVVYHVGGGSLAYDNPQKTYLNFRNSLFMLFKNLPASALWWRLLIRFQMDELAAMRSVFKNGNFKIFFAILKANLAFLVAIPALLKKRKHIPQKSSEALLPYSVVWQYFLKGKKKFSELPTGDRRGE
ncbi:MAG: glycosyltransferase family 2 protein [Chitinophagales bacterium]|nr:glycosyltransferase family 2 protein [Chitinophagales bacterium]